ncbi:mannitol dehydrogenase family protein [Antarctobacter sp.]|uniref:mannitol dehydrogenase family protein n=1 Tax=Antarctobacter sp. TaxID=1872577 RepID=UPI002B269F3E|nr:mannitol dehydrogenase family protein [Antarctobacter sp.]
MTKRLTAGSALPDGVMPPTYDPAAHGEGIVHIGLGAFHKAHQAVYTDDALAAAGGDWRIVGVSLRSAAPAEELSPQDGRYTLIERSVEGSRARVVGSMSRALCLKTDRAAVLKALCAPSTRIVSITVTEKGYGLDRATGGIDPTHPAIAADLARPKAPEGLAGLLVWALAERRRKGVPPFTVLCCDNLPENGHLVRSLLTDMARHCAPDLVEHLTQNVAFPCTMVDRITPARSPDTLALALAMIGFEDRATVETEAFRQWVIEDHFPTGRPDWETGGALFVRDVRPFEEMKLRMLNGTHSMLAYTGFLAGYKYVRNVMGDPALSRLVTRHLGAAASTLDPLPGVDFGLYTKELTARFANPHLGHETYQIAMDGSEKMPQRIFAPALDALHNGQPLDAFAFATAAWVRYTVGRTDGNEAYDLRDPLSAKLAPAIDAPETAATLYDRIVNLPGLFPTELSASARWRSAVIERLGHMLSAGMQAAIQSEVAKIGD